MFGRGDVAGLGTAGRCRKVRDRPLRSATISFVLLTLSLAACRSQSYAVRFTPPESFSAQPRGCCAGSALMVGFWSDPSHTSRGTLNVIVDKTLPGMTVSRFTRDVKTEVRFFTGCDGIPMATTTARRFINGSEYQDTAVVAILHERAVTASYVHLAAFPDYPPALASLRSLCLPR